MRIPFITNIIEKQMEKAAIKTMGAAYAGGSVDLIDLFSMAAGYDGDKFENGFGMTKNFQVVNLKKLQYRSIQLIRENLYANALFTRLETKVINKGLTLNSSPMLDILGSRVDVDDKFLRKWSRTVEAEFHAWSRDKKLVSWNEEADFAKLQRIAYHTALLSGDCLVIISINKYGMPVVKLVDGFYVSSPLIKDLKKNIVHGVELDKDGKEIAYHVEDGEGGHVRVKAYGNGTKRRRAWLLKGTQQRISDVRGMPILGIVMQNFNEAGKYLGSEQRAALVNSYIALSRNRDPEQGPSNRLLGGKRGANKGVTITKNKDGENVKFEQQQPGLYLANLAPNEKIESFDTKRPNKNFVGFLEATIKPCAYANEIPPETFFMEYGNNFSASRQAKLDFNESTDKRRFIFARDFNDLIYQEVLTGLVLNGSVEAPGYIASLNDPRQYQIKNAWQNTVWRGLPATSVDIKKLVQSLEIARTYAWLTDEQITEAYFGGDWFDNIRRKGVEESLMQKNIIGNQPPVEDSVANAINTVVMQQFLSKLSTIEKSVKVISDKIEDIEDIDTGDK